MNNSSLAMVFGMAVILVGMVVMILGYLPAAQGELAFYAGLAILLVGAIGAMRRD